MYTYHIHSNFSDGANTPDEIVLAALQTGIVALGFSDHGFTDYDLRYCMKDQAAYVTEIRRLKERYKDKIQIYIGVEEDAFYPLCRREFYYIIGSCHYIKKDGQYFPIDSGYDHFKKCLSLFENDYLAFAQAYYSSFCDYIHARRPDIIGHFDLITKYDEQEDGLLLKDPKYHEIAEKFILKAMQSGCIFEINTGAIARGHRTLPYPYENLLFLMKKHNCPVLLSSDSHKVDTLTFQFEEAKSLLRNIGFTERTVLLDGSFRQIEL